MHQLRERLGLRPRPRWGAYSAPPDPLADLARIEKGADRKYLVEPPFSKPWLRPWNNIVILSDYT